MALFNLDIDRYYHTQKDNGFELKSIAYIQYPIYCIHTTIVDSTPDPLDKLDKSIVQCINLKNDITSFDISRMLSVKKEIVEQEINKLINEDLITQKGSSFTITENAIEIIIKGKGHRLTNRNYDFFIDGITLELLPKIFYSNKYLNSLISETQLSFYTDKKGETRISKPYNPNIVPEPVNKEVIIKNILDLDENKRETLNVPVGIESIKGFDYTKMSFPILVGLFEKDGVPVRKLIDGFTATGDPEYINSFYVNLKDKLENLKLKLSVWKKEDEEEYNILFKSNWDEIDIKSNDDELQFISTEDLKIALEHFYDISDLSDLSDENIINTNFDIGLVVTPGLLHKLNSGKKRLLKNLFRGKDYQMVPFYGGIWIVFMKFITNSDHINELIEISQFIQDAKDKKLEIEQIVTRLSKYNNFRKALLEIEEFDLLEKIDINDHMYTMK